MDFVKIFKSENHMSDSSDFYHLHKQLYIEKKCCFRKNLRFFMDCHDLECSEHDVTIFRECPFLCVCVIIILHVTIICSDHKTKSNEQNFMKFYLQLFFDINLYISNFGANRSRGGARIVFHFNFQHRDIVRISSKCSPCSLSLTNV